VREGGSLSRLLIGRVHDAELVQPNSDERNAPRPELRGSASMVLARLLSRQRGSARGPMQ